MLHLMINCQTLLAELNLCFTCLCIKSNVHERYLVGGMYTYTYHQSLAVMIQFPNWVLTNSAMLQSLLAILQLIIVYCVRNHLSCWMVPEDEAYVQLLQYLCTIEKPWQFASDCSDQWVISVQWLVIVLVNYLLSLIDFSVEELLRGMWTCRSTQNPTLVCGNVSCVVWCS